MSIVTMVENKCGLHKIYFSFAIIYMSSLVA